MENPEPRSDGARVALRGEIDYERVQWPHLGAPSRRRRAVRAWRPSMRLAADHRRHAAYRDASSRRGPRYEPAVVSVRAKRFRAGHAASGRCLACYQASGKGSAARLSARFVCSAMCGALVFARSPVCLQHLSATVPQGFRKPRRFVRWSRLARCTELRVARAAPENQLPPRSESPITRAASNKPLTISFSCSLVMRALGTEQLIASNAGVLFGSATAKQHRPGVFSSRS